MMLFKRLNMKGVFSTLFILLNLTVLVLIILPVLPTSISLWWLDNLLNLQIQWSIFAALLVFINIFYFKIATGVVSIVYMVLIAYNLAPLYSQHEKTSSLTSLSHKKINIAQLNLHYDNPNIVNLLPTLGDAKFDLLIVQEASDQQHQALNQLATYYPYSFGISANQSTPDGMAIFSRFPIIEQYSHALGQQQGHLLEILLQIEEIISPIQLYALHPPSPRTEQLWHTRNTVLIKSANMISASPFINKIVVGDFNSSPWSTEFKNFQATSQLKSSANGFGYIASWAYCDAPLLSLLSSAYIDHHLISRSFNVTNKTAHEIEGSDHKMIITEIALAK